MELWWRKCRNLCGVQQLARRKDGKSRSWRAFESWYRAHATYLEDWCIAINSRVCEIARPKEVWIQVSSWRKLAICPRLTDHSRWQGKWKQRNWPHKRQNTYDLALGATVYWTKSTLVILATIVPSAADAATDNAADIWGNSERTDR